MFTFIDSKYQEQTIEKGWFDNRKMNKQKFEEQIKAKGLVNALHFSSSIFMSVFAIVSTSQNPGLVSLICAQLINWSNDQGDQRIS